LEDHERKIVIPRIEQVVDWMGAEIDESFPDPKFYPQDFYMREAKRKYEDEMFDPFAISADIHLETYKKVEITYQGRVLLVWQRMA